MQETRDWWAWGTTILDGFGREGLANQDTEN